MVSFLPSPRASRRGDRNGLLARQVLAGERVGVLEELLVGAGVHHATAELPGAGSDVDDEVGQADGLLVVFDHDDRVAEVAQSLERGDQSAVVALVQSDRRLVQHVEHARRGSCRSDWPGGCAAPRRPTSVAEARESVR